MSSENLDPHLHKASITWTIADFLSLIANEDSVKSPNFSAATCNEVVWHLVLPKGENDEISLFVYPNYDDKFSDHIHAFLNVHILTNNGGKTPSKKTKIHRYTEYAKPDDEDDDDDDDDDYTMKSVGWGWKNFWTIDEYFRTNLLSNNALTICVEVVFSEYHHVLMNSYNEISLQSTPNHGNLAANLASLLETQAFSDVVLCTNGKDFPAHKVILAARSKVFAAMFQHDTKENQLNRIDIEDLSEGTVAEMLRFIYTEKCEKLDELAEELLAAADKYDLTRLKIICSRALYKTLSVENAAHVLILADTFNTKELKNDVIEFIVSRAFDVMGMANWKNVVPNSELVNEVCQALARHMVCEEFDKAP